MMNEIFVSFLLRSITGGFVAAVFMLSVKKIYKVTSAKFIVFLNTIVLLTFVIPFHELLSWQDGSGIAFSRFQLIILLQQGNRWASFCQWANTVRLADIITALWVAGIFFYLIFYSFLYFCFIHKVKKESFPICHTAWQDAFHTVCNRENINLTINLVANTRIGEPCVTGIYRKSVVIPADLLNTLEKNEIEIILRHEIMHIKRKDITLKLCILVFNSINWFNPLYYFLKQNLFEWTEIRCDEYLIVSMSKQERNIYRKTLIKILERETIRQQKYFVSSFGNSSGRNLKRRVYGIMKKKEKDNFVVKTAITALAIASISVGTVWAKEADVVVNSIFSNQVSLLDEEQVSFHNEPVEAVAFFKVAGDKIKKGIEDGTVMPFRMEFGGAYTYQIIFEDGQPVQLITNKKESNSKHLHQYEDANISVHKKYSNGSCKTIVYEALHCSICDEYWKGDILNEYTQKYCTHS